MDTNTQASGGYQMSTSKQIVTALALVVSAAFIQPAQAQVVIQEHILAPEATEIQTYYGTQIALDDNVVVVGASGDDEHGFGVGAIYVYNRSTGMLIRKMSPADANDRDLFGSAVALKDGLIAVSSPKAVETVEGQLLGAFVYLFDASTGEQLAKLTGDDTELTDMFGYSVALGNGVLAVGAPGDGAFGPRTGSVHLFDVHTGEQIAKIKASDAHREHWFGRSLAIDNGVLAVGTVSSGSGTVYLYDLSTRTELIRLEQEVVDANRGGGFGGSIDMDDGVVIVGAEGLNVYVGDSRIGQAGAAYLFDIDTGLQINKLVASDLGHHHFFGSSVAIENGVATVGAPINHAVYLFDVSSGFEQSKISILPSNDLLSGSNFGSFVAMHKRSIAVGSCSFINFGQEDYPSYIYHIECAADLNSDDVFDFFDVSMFLEAFANNESIADFTDDGAFDFFDIAAFLEEFSGNCL